MKKHGEKMARKVYHVVPSGESWLVKLSGEVLSKHYHKDNAVTEAVRLAKASQPSQVLVHRRDGTFEYEYTYGQDPERYPG
ncbi:MAG: DUF2188 domain-containing protein [Anaerolineales bacterium]|nr:MAG: DUF2188 domain-containing protein [Anaerolineales bacterium]